MSYFKCDFFPSSNGQKNVYVKALKKKTTNSRTPASLHDRFVECTQNLLQILKYSPANEKGNTQKHAMSNNYDVFAMLFLFFSISNYYYCMILVNLIEHFQFMFRQSSSVIFLLSERRLKGQSKGAATPNYRIHSYITE